MNQMKTVKAWAVVGKISGLVHHRSNPHRLFAVLATRKEAEDFASADIEQIVRVEIREVPKKAKVKR